MNVAEVDNVCSHLSPLFKNTIRTKILTTAPVDHINFGEALLFFVADWLTRVNVIPAEQIRVLLEEFANRILDFGTQLEANWLKPDVKGHTQLPICKLGFLDRRFVCMDGCSTFLELKTGKTVKAIDVRPLETIAFNLTALFIQYHAEIRRSKSRDLNGTNNELHADPADHPQRQG